MSVLHEAWIKRKEESRGERDPPIPGQPSRKCNIEDERYDAERY